MSAWHQETLTIDTPGRGLYDATGRIADVVKASGITMGLCHLFLQHTSASLVIQENADPDVLQDLVDWLERLAPDGDPRYRHVDEGPDDMSAHLKSTVTHTSLTVPIEDRRLALGTWQAIYLIEHRLRPHLQLRGALRERIDGGRAVEDRELRVDVEVDERHRFPGELPRTRERDVYPLADQAVRKRPPGSGTLTGRRR